MKKDALEASELNVVRKSCTYGLGISLMPDVMIEAYLHEGRLVRVLDDWSANSRDIYMLV